MSHMPLTQPLDVCVEMSRVSDKVVLNVGGVRHIVEWSTLKMKPSTKLGSESALEEYFNASEKEYYFDRSPRLFDFILNYYRCGVLHVNKCQCAREFSEELSFWEIQEDAIGSCCWLDYRSQFATHAAREEFVSRGESKLRREIKTTNTTQWGRFRDRAWTFLNEPFSSKASLVYAVVSLCVVLVSIFTLCASTSPAFKRPLTLQDYANYFDVDADTLVDAWYGTEYWSLFSDSWTDMKNSDSNGQGNESTTGIKTQDHGRKRRNIASSPATGSNVYFDPDPPQAVLSDPVIWDKDHSKQHAICRNFLIYSCKQIAEKLNQQPACVASYHDRSRRSPNPDEGQLPPNTTGQPPQFMPDGGQPRPNTTGQPPQFMPDQLLGVPNHYIEWTDYVCYAFFFVEIILRLIFCPSFKSYFRSVLNWMDILLVMLFIADMTINRVITNEMYELSSADILFVLRVARVFKIFRLANHHKGVEVLTYTLKASLKEIMLLLIFLWIGVLVFSCLIYYTDHGVDKFQSIAHSFWWAIITMTTVGYGDMYPETTGGKVVGTACAISGVLMIAFTVPIIVNNFMMFYELVEFGKHQPSERKTFDSVDRSVPSNEDADTSLPTTQTWA